MKTVKAAICQYTTKHEKQHNIDHAITLIEKAADGGAQLVCLPEIFYYPYELRSMRTIADRDNQTVERLQGIAEKKEIFLCTGSLSMQTGKEIRNTAYLVGPKGDILLSYSKSHLFDVHFKDLRVKESVVFTPGNKVSVVDTAIGKMGILICYDIRFPEMARTCVLKGAEIILVPAAFNMITGPAHWHILMRTRAMENQVYLLAASQARVEHHAYVTYGHSLIVDPWGTICADAGKDETILYGDLHAETLKDTRMRLPQLNHRRPDIYFQ